MEFKGTQGDFKIGIAFQGETENIKIKTNGQLLVIEDVDGKAVAIIGRIGEPEQEANAKLLVQSKKMFDMLKKIAYSNVFVSDTDLEIRQLLTKITEL